MVINIELKVNNKGKYFLFYNLKNLFPEGITYKEIGEILNPISKASAKTTFDAYIKAIDEKADLNKVKKEIRKQIVESLPDKKKEEEETSDKSIDTWDKLKEKLELLIPNRIEEIQLLLSVVVSLEFSKGSAIYLILLGDYGIGKTVLCQCFGDGDRTYQLDDLTANVMATGTVTDKDEAYSVLNDLKNKTFFIDDLTLILSDKGEKIEKFLGFLVNAFGKKKGIKKASPGSHGYYGGRFNSVFGMTWDLWKDHGSTFLKHERFITYKLKGLNDYEIFVDDKKEPNTEEIRNCIYGFLENILVDDMPEITVEKELKDKIYDFVWIIDVLRNVWFDKEKKVWRIRRYKMGRVLRRAKQLRMLCRARAHILGADKVREEDINFFKTLFWFGEKDIVIERKLKTWFDLDGVEVQRQEYFQNLIFFEENV